MSIAMGCRERVPILPSLRDRLIFWGGRKVKSSVGHTISERSAACRGPRWACPDNGRNNDFKDVVKEAVMADNGTGKLKAATPKSQKIKSQGKSGQPGIVAPPPAKLRISPLKTVCVYCGSGAGVNPSYAQAARVLGQSLAERGIGLVYGGGGLGLMGEVARATIAAGGHVTGIIPEFLLQKEHALAAADELIVTGDMHERKRLMFERSDAFIALPGGIGTLEELVEQLTWAQLGRHTKPIVLANIDGFWTPFLELLRHMKAETFIRSGLDVTFSVVDQAENIVTAAEARASMTASLPEGVSVALF